MILASGSQIRRAMLHDAGVEFAVIPADIDEASLRATIAGMPLTQQAEILAKEKAKAVSALHPNARVIGADQIAALDGDILTKPGTAEKACAQLARLSGNTHQQHSAVAVYHAGTCLWSHVDTAILTMRALDEAEIADYVAADNPTHSCGAYCYELGGKKLFHHVEGDYHTILGMPLTPLLAFLG